MSSPSTRCRGSFRSVDWHIRHYHSREENERTFVGLWRRVKRIFWPRKEFPPWVMHCYSEQVDVTYRMWKAYPTFKHLIDKRHSTPCLWGHSFHASQMKTSKILRNSSLPEACDSVDATVIKLHLIHLETYIIHPKNHQLFIKKAAFHRPSRPRGRLLVLSKYRPEGP